MGMMLFCHHCQQFACFLVAEELVWLPCVPWLSLSSAAVELVMTPWWWLPALAPSGSAASWEPSRLPFPDARGLASGNFRAQSCSHVENIFPAIRHPSNPEPRGRVSLHQHVPCHGLWPRAPQCITAIPSSSSTCRDHHMWVQPDLSWATVGADSPPPWAGACQ